MTTNPKNQDPDSLPADKLDALTAPDGATSGSASTPPSKDSTVVKQTPGTSSLEPPPSEPTVQVPRVGAPDSTPADSYIDGLDGVSRGTLEEAAAEDARVRAETDEKLHGGKFEALPPVSAGDRNAAGNVAPNDLPVGEKQD